MNELEHGDLAYVVDRLGGGDEMLAQYNRHDEIEYAYWAYFGSDWTSRPNEVEIVRRVKVVDFD